MTHTPPTHTAANPAPTTNVMALAALILGVLGISVLPVLGSVAAVVCGHIARRQLRTRVPAQQGHNLATAGLVLGWVVIAACLLGAIMVIAFGAMLLQSYSAYLSNHT